MTTTLSSRELNQDIGRAKRAAQTDPVLITSRGKPTHVLLSFDDYERLTSKGHSLADALAMPETAATGFEPAKVSLGLRIPDFD